VEALTGATADAGSIPAASIFPANRYSGSEHLVAGLLQFEERLGEVGRVELRVPRRRANVGVTQEELRQAYVVVRTLELRCSRMTASVHVHSTCRAPLDEARAPEAAVTTRGAPASRSACGRVASG
jgi:hypothetical protein